MATRGENRNYKDMLGAQISQTRRRKVFIHKKYAACVIIEACCNYFSPNFSATRTENFLTPEHGQRCIKVW